MISQSKKSDFAKDQQLWSLFKERHTLTQKQLEQFQEYYALLIKANTEYNLTTITHLRPVLEYHFTDSLVLANFIHFSTITSIADVGTGGGFPGIPLKIKYPDLRVILIEVTHKKRVFLQEVIDTLGLTDIEVSQLDWRTFLRKTDYALDIFCARASLQPEELIRMFKPSCPYNQAVLIYWASKEWQPTVSVASYIEQQEEYAVGNKHRKLVFFKKILL